MKTATVTPSGHLLGGVHSDRAQSKTGEEKKLHRFYSCTTVIILIFIIIILGPGTLQEGRGYVLFCILPVLVSYWLSLSTNAQCE